MVQQGKKTLAIRSLLLMVLCTTMFAFSERFGGDSFTIYLNDELLLREHVTAGATVKNLFLTGDASDVLKIRYSHCGKTGINRSVAIQNGQKEIIKAWHFPDDGSPVMDIKVTEILAALPMNAVRPDFTLVYSSIEIPKGKALAAIGLSDENKASLK
jgi:hypothetical protein